MRDNPKFFVSYKTEDIDFVRFFAERLKAEGHSPWFNEYDIRHDQIDSFQKVINDGIDRCAWGLLFVNDLYTRSPYCLVEVERLLRRLPVERIVVFDRDQQTARFLEMYPELSGSVVPTRGSAEVFAKLFEMGAISTIPDPVEPITRRGQNSWLLQEIGAQFDRNVWSVETASALWQPQAPERLDITGERRHDYHRFSARFRERTVRLWVDYALIEKELGHRLEERISEWQDGTLRLLEDEQDDRRRLREELEYFVDEVGRTGRLVSQLAGRREQDADGTPMLEEIGIHMFSTTEICGGSRNSYKHRLFSFRLPAERSIFRVYKLVLPQPQMGVPVAVRFIFQFEDDERAFFATLPWCDYVASSIQWINLARSPALSLSDLARKASEIRGGRHDA